MAGTILIDLQKAFDTIDDDILLKKLSAIVFSNHTVGWFKSYLSNRLLDPWNGRQGSYKFGPICTSVRPSVRSTTTDICRERFINFFPKLGMKLEYRKT